MGLLVLLFPEMIDDLKAFKVKDGKKEKKLN